MQIERQCHYSTNHLSFSPFPMLLTFLSMYFQYPTHCYAVENEAHCDFVKLREMLIRVNMEDLREQTHSRHYELYRRCKLEEMGFKDTDPDSKPFRYLSRQPSPDQLSPPRGSGSRASSVCWSPLCLCTLARGAVEL